MDNLDRTNVVQSSIAKWSLNNQLQELGILSDGETVDQHSEFMRIFRNGGYWSTDSEKQTLTSIFQYGQTMQTLYLLPTAERVL
jgi:hypothetical protein